MKIYTQGARFHGGQVDRIDQGFTELGQTLTPYSNDADLVYLNNGPYRQAAIDKFSNQMRGKLICTVLDIPEHLLPNFDLEGLYRELMHADEICAISEYVKWQLLHYLGLHAKVIYNPIKPIHVLPRIENATPRFLSVGRRYDSNKRFNMGVEALKRIGVQYNQLALVGSETTVWGDTLGVLNDSHLNDIYNSVDFVFALGKIEGLNLPVCESMAAAVIPIVCNDMTTRKEFLPPEIFPEYNDVDPNPESVAKFINGFIKDKEKMSEFKTRLHNHYLKNWQATLSPKGVATSILDVYNSL